MSDEQKPELHLLRGNSLDAAKINRLLEDLTGEPTTPEEAAETQAMIERILAKRRKRAEEQGATGA